MRGSKHPRGIIGIGPALCRTSQNSVEAKFAEDLARTLAERSSGPPSPTLKLSTQLQQGVGHSEGLGVFGTPTGRLKKREQTSLEEQGGVASLYPTLVRVHSSPIHCRMVKWSGCEAEASRRSR